MHIEIDQSGKIEQLNKDTVVAFSNDYQYAVLLKKSVKNDVYREYKGRVKQLRYKLFCICLYYCVKDYTDACGMMLIDCEYAGKENLIKSLLLGFLRLQRPLYDGRAIRFCQVTKKSPAHAVAIDVYRRNRKPNRILSREEIISLL